MTINNVEHVFHQAVAHYFAGSAQDLVQVLGLDLQCQALPGCDHRSDLQEIKFRLRTGEKVHIDREFDFHVGTNAGLADLKQIVKNVA